VPHLNTKQNTIYIYISFPYLGSVKQSFPYMCFLTSFYHIFFCYILVWFLTLLLLLFIKKSW